MRTETQLAKLLGQIPPWVRTTLETSKARVEFRMMDSTERFTKKLHRKIDSFVISIRERLCDAWVPDLSSLEGEVATLRSEVRKLAESHGPITPSHTSHSAAIAYTTAFVL